MQFTYYFDNSKIVIRMKNRCINYLVSRYTWRRYKFLLAHSRVTFLIFYKGGWIKPWVKWETIYQREDNLMLTQQFSLSLSEANREENSRETSAHKRAQACFQVTIEPATGISDTQKARFSIGDSRNVTCDVARSIATLSIRLHPSAWTGRPWEVQVAPSERDEKACGDRMDAAWRQVSHDLGFHLSYTLPYLTLRSGCRVFPAYRWAPIISLGRAKVISLLS